MRLASVRRNDFARDFACAAILLALGCGILEPCGGLARAEGVAAPTRPPRARTEADAPAGSPKSANPAPDTKARLDIRFDFEVVERFLGFVERGSATSAELDQWTRLRGNRELLRAGRLEGGLTADILAEAARATIAGGQFAAPPTLGALDGGDWNTLRRILASIRTRQRDILAEATEALSPYIPEKHPLPPLQVFFHLGGSWDGHSTDAVYINLTLFQARGLEGLPGLDALLVHELFHQLQAALVPAREDYSSRQSALYTTLLRLQQEGTARHLEYKFLEAASIENDLDRTNYEKYRQGLESAASQATVLARIRESIASGRLDEARLGTTAALQGGGPLYAVGHAMARTIETVLGGEALARTVAGGPLAFARSYQLSAVSAGQETMLPAGLEADLAALEAGYGRDPVLASARRREGLGLIHAGKLGDAAKVLREAIRADPSDSTSAYNLACVYALKGKSRRALKWLEDAFDRGFDKYKHAVLDDDLASLRGEPAFAAMLRERGFDYQPPPEN